MFQQPESYSFNWLIIIIEDIIVEYEGLQLPIQDSAQFIKKVIRYLLTITSIHNSHKWTSNFIQKYMGFEEGVGKVPYDYNLRIYTTKFSYHDP